MSLAHGQSQLAPDLRTRQLQRTLALRERELAMLSSLAARIHGEETTRRIWEVTLEEILEKLDLRAAWVFMGEEGSSSLRLVAQRGVSSEYLEELRSTGLGTCLCPEVFLSGHSREVRNTTQCPRMPRIVAGLTEPVAHACVPLTFEGRRQGVLNVAAGPGGTFSDEELRFLETVGHQTCIALERAAHRQAERSRNEEAQAMAREARNAYQDLKDAQQRLVSNEKMAVLGTFASGLAHEVRNPLNSIGLQLSILERRVARLHAERPRELTEVIGVIREEIKRLDNLVGDFLLFSRTNRLQHQLADLDALIQDVMRLLGPEAEASNVLLDARGIGLALPPVRLDAEKMRQVIINLVRNAIEAMPEGGRVTVESGLVDGRALIVVRDTGPGLPEDIDVFQLFVTTKAKGTGLGLSIAQQIVLEHGGEITVDSRPKRGAAISVSLPRQPPETRRQEGSPS